MPAVQGAGSGSGLVPRLRGWDPRGTDTLRLPAVLIPGPPPRLLAEDALGQERRGTAMEVVTPMLGCVRLGAGGAGDMFIPLGEAMLWSASHTTALPASPLHPAGGWGGSLCAAPRLRGAFGAES